MHFNMFSWKMNGINRFKLPVDSPKCYNMVLQSKTHLFL